MDLETYLIFVCCFLFLIIIAFAIYATVLEDRVDRLKIERDRREKYYQDTLNLDVGCLETMRKMVRSAALHHGNDSEDYVDV